MSEPPREPPNGPPFRLPPPPAAAAAPNATAPQTKRRSHPSRPKQSPRVCVCLCVCASVRKFAPLTAADGRLPGRGGALLHPTAVTSDRFFPPARWMRRRAAIAQQSYP